MTSIWRLTFTLFQRQVLATAIVFVSLSTTTTTIYSFVTSPTAQQRNLQSLFLISPIQKSNNAGSIITTGSCNTNAVVANPSVVSREEVSTSSATFYSQDQLNELESMYQKSNNDDIHRRGSYATPREMKKVKSTSTRTLMTTTDQAKPASRISPKTTLKRKPTTTPTQLKISSRNHDDGNFDDVHDNSNGSHQRRAKGKMQRSKSQHSRVNPSKMLISNRIDSTAGARSSVGVTREEEIKYSFQLRTFRAAVLLRDSLVYQDQSTGMYIHPTEEQWASACGTSVPDLRRIMLEGQDARTALVAANVGLVTSQATKFYYATKQQSYNRVFGGVGTILTIQDLIQEGNLGLMEAAERYKPEKGFRFSTYATWWIKQRILKSITDTGRIIRLPAHVHGMLQKIQRAKKDLMNSTGKEPTLQELSQYLEIPVEKLQQLTSRNNVVVSLESPLTSGSSFKVERRTVGETLAWENENGNIRNGSSGGGGGVSSSSTGSANMNNPTYDDVETEDLRRDIRAVMDSTLTASYERDVIIHRFGLDDHHPRSVSETATVLGISTDKVRLIEARALNKLRHPQRNHVLKDYIVSGKNSGGSSSSSIGTTANNNNNKKIVSSIASLTPDRVFDDRGNVPTNSGRSKIMDPATSVPRWMQHTKDFVRMEGYGLPSDDNDDDNDQHYPTTTTSSSSNISTRKRVEGEDEQQNATDDIGTLSLSHHQQQREQQKQKRLWLY